MSNFISMTPLMQDPFMLQMDIAHARWPSYLVLVLNFNF